MSDSPLQVTVNGEVVLLTDVQPFQTLLEFLRGSGRVGSKEGCAEGDCGACTVAVLGEGPEGRAHYQAMNSCLIPLATMAGREVVTVEGVATEPSKLHPVQRAMIETGGSQCGYCTPGFIMSMFAAYYDGAVDDHSVEGNLCRCTGYLPIRRAAQSLSKPAAQDAFIRGLEAASPKLHELRYEGGNFSFFRPTRLSEAFELLRDHPEARLVAGATDLGLDLSKFYRYPEALVSTEAIEELRVFDVGEDAVTIGAALPLTHIEKRLAGVFPALDEMLYWFAARQVRNRATIGGNLATASPIGDLPPVLMALDARVELASSQGRRSVAVSEFFTGYRQTVMQPGDIIVSVCIPTGPAEGAGQRLSQSYKVGKRGTDDISIVAAAFTVDLDDAGRIVQARLAYGGVAATPLRAMEVEASLLGQGWTEQTVGAAKAQLEQAFTPLSDLRGSAEYRRLLVGNLFEKFFLETRPEKAAA